MITYPISSNFWEKHFSGMLSALQFSIFLISSVIEDFLFISFQQKNEMKMGNALMEFKYCFFPHLFDVKDFKRNLTDGIWLENVFKENLVLQFSWLEEFR